MSIHCHNVKSQEGIREYGQTKVIQTELSCTWSFSSVSLLINNHCNIVNEFFVLKNSIYNRRLVRINETYTPYLTLGQNCQQILNASPNCSAFWLTLRVRFGLPKTL